MSFNSWIAQATSRLSCRTRSLHSHSAMMVITEMFNEDSKFCKAADHLPSLDFAGLVALVGTAASEAGVPYTCLVRGRIPYLNAYMTSGTLGLAHAVLACIDWWPARFLTGHQAGEGGSMLELFMLKASGKATYFGLQSGTIVLIRCVVGEALVSELVMQGKTHDNARESCGRDANRPTYVVRAKIRKPVDGEVDVSGEGGAFLSVIATLVSLTVVMLNAQCRQWFALSVVAVGMFLNASLGILLRLRKYQFVLGKSAPGSPPGDCVVQLIDEPDSLCVLQGMEDAVQGLLQREVKETGFTHPLPLFLVCVAMIAHSAVVVLGTPHMGATSQLLLLIAVAFGAMTDLLKGSWDGKRGIAKEALGKYGIEIVDAIQFGNRTAAVAYVAAGSSKPDALHRAGVLPTTGLVWTSWWEALGTLVRDGGMLDPNELDAHVQVSLQSPSVDTLWTDLRGDMYEGYSKARSNPWIVSTSQGYSKARSNPWVVSTS